MASDTQLKQQLSTYGVSYGMDPAAMSASQVDKAILDIGGAGLKHGGWWNYYQKLQAQKAVNDANAAYAEMLAGINASMASAAKAAKMQVAATDRQAAAIQAAAAEAAKAPPYNEILKTAPSATDYATDQTAQRQAMRRGLLSTFSDFGTTLGRGTRLAT